MTQQLPTATTIDAMPRGGPNASWLDRRLQTDVLEYTDRYDVPDELKQHVITSLDDMGVRRQLHEKNARLALDLVVDVDAPRILELGAGHGRLSEQILQLHPTAQVTVSDLDPTSVQNIADGPLGADPRACTKVIDATAIDEPDDSYDLVVFAAAFHHLPPNVAYRAIAEATRVGTRFLVVDLKRPPALLHVLVPLVLVPVALLMLPRAAVRATLHDGLISSLRSYSPAAFTALGSAADPGMRTEFLDARMGFPRPVAVVFTRP